MNLSRKMLFLLMSVSIAVGTSACKESVDELLNSTENSDDSGSGDTGSGDTGSGGGETNDEDDSDEGTETSEIECFGTDETDIDDDVPDWAESRRFGRVVGQFVAGCECAGGHF